jgi:phosphoribosylanthranilate isomerase
VIRALRLHSDAALDAIDLGEIKADFILIDTFHPQLFGGTGRARRLDALSALDLSRVFVSGGLAPDNVAEAAALNPYGLDVASGVEAAPGIKDASKLGSFIANARSLKSSSINPDSSPDSSPASSPESSPGPFHADAKLPR